MKNQMKNEELTEVKIPKKIKTRQIGMIQISLK